MTHWVRLWADMPTDPKWRTIARKSGQPLSCVIALFTLMLTTAGTADDRGSVSGLSVEDAATALDIDEEDVAAILEAMQGRVVSEGRLSGWEKRQPKREDDGAAARKAAWKARKEAQRNAVERNGTHGHAPDTESETDTDSEIKNEDKPHSSARDPGEIDSEAERLLQKAAREAAAQQPITEAMGEWNVAAAEAGWPTISKLTDKRRSHVRNRLREHQIDGWRAAIERARSSPYLGGSDPPSWFTFDWISKPENFLKLIEGNYDRRSSGSDRREGPDRRNALARAADRHLELLERGGAADAGAG